MVDFIFLVINIVMYVEKFNLRDFVFFEVNFLIWGVNVIVVFIFLYIFIFVYYVVCFNINYLGII